MSRTVWLSRDNMGAHYCNYYELWDEEPILAGSVYDIDEGNCVFSFCVEDFERFSAIRLKPGECVAVEFRDPFIVKEPA